MNFTSPNPPRILAIESSCDETAVAIYQHKLLAHALHTQIELHQAYGGVVPELASRDHLTYIMPLVREALAQAQCTLDQIDVFAYTKGPGLSGCLLIGATVAKTLAFACAKPSLGIHHLEGHLLAPFLNHDLVTSNSNSHSSSNSTEAPAAARLQFPFLALLVSGGHTQFIYAHAVGEYDIIGDTLDDALGEAFDKTAKMLGMPYPGGAEVSRLANLGTASFDLPKPMLHSGDLQLSFSGLKTAVLHTINKQKQLNLNLNLNLNLKLNQQQSNGLTQIQIADICASFVASVVVLMRKKTTLALEYVAKHYADAKNMRHVVITGGVGANQQLRAALTEVALKHGLTLVYPPLEWCTDNAAMIAVAAHLSATQQTPTAFRQQLDQGLDIQIYPRCEL